MKTFLTIALLGFISMIKAQDPINWSYVAKKIDDKTYEIKLTATIKSGWHLYSQVQGEDAIAIPTDIQFKTNPLLKMDGKIKEVGKLEKFEDKKLGVTANQYSNKVDFVQVVKLKATAKTNVSGTIEYQTCNDERCLPPKKINFSVAIR